MYYVHMGDLLSVNRVEEDGTLLTQSSEVPVKTGDIIITNEFGNSSVVPEDTFYKFYKPVRKVRKSRKPTTSPFEEAYAKQLMEFSLDSNIESDEYITGTRDLIQNKPL
jgi:hypothetical protein